jgi:hypothetical protein
MVRPAEELRQAKRLAVRERSLEGCVEPPTRGIIPALFIGASGHQGEQSWLVGQLLQQLRQALTWHMPGGEPHRIGALPQRGELCGGASQAPSDLTTVSAQEQRQGVRGVARESLGGQFAAIESRCNSGSKVLACCGGGVLIDSRSRGLRLGRRSLMNAPLHLSSGPIQVAF